MNYCCHNCFENDYLRYHILANGVNVDCDFCNSINTVCVEASSLKEIFEPLVRLYVPAEEVYSTSILTEMDLSEDSLYAKIAYDWGVFDDADRALEILDAIFDFDPRDGEESIMNRAVVFEDFDRYLDSFDIAERPSGNLNWEVFSHEIKHQRRFRPITFNETAFKMIAELLSVQMVRNLVFFRARIEEAKPYSSTEMGSPPVEKATFGRINPQGIAYLYLSNTKDTCVAEVRPNISNTISIGTFKVTEELNILDVTNPQLCPFKYRSKLREMIGAQNLLTGFANAMALPVDPKDSYLEYLPSQYVCEFVKSLGFDGIKYKSSQGKGFNLALFASDKVECIEVIGQQGITAIQYKYEPNRTFK